MMARTEMQQQEYGTIDADKVLIALGAFAPYQCFVMVLLSITWVFMAFQVMSWVFIGIHHPFTCVDSLVVSLHIVCII